ncbi:hypothetical protein EV426DRAFT_614132 [Tirmania nivea]|nr:hypothetical protein EV426DRAFT_614132 [Tirmania nivea]
MRKHPAQLWPRHRKHLSILSFLFLHPGWAVPAASKFPQCNLACMSLTCMLWLTDASPGFCNVWHMNRGSILSLWLYMSNR